MHGDVRFIEDIPQLAAEASELANHHCGTCQNYHFLWPYLRLIGAPGAADNAKALVESAIAGSIATGHRRILIAGAADTGLLALVAHAAAGHGVDIVVLDRCETPLELCRRFARRWSLSIETLCVDLMTFAAEPSFDIVFAHSLLMFIPPERRLDVLTRLRKSLRPNGRLIIRFQTRGRIEPNHLPAYRDSVPTHLINQLESMGIALPESQQSFRQRIEAYAQERHARESTEVHLSDVERMIESAGFSIETISPLESSHPAPFRQSTADVSKRRFLALAKPR